MTNPTKTGLDTIKLIDSLKSSIEFWTSSMQHFCFERVRKIRCVSIFEFVLQLAKNRSDGAQTILDSMCIEHNVQGGNILKSSMSEARDKVVVNMWKQVQHDIANSLRREIKGRRYFAIDGTVLCFQNAKFAGKFKKAYGSYLPHGFGSMLYDIDYGFPIDVILDEKLDERSAAMRHLEHLVVGDVVVMDRGYYSRDILDAFTEKGVHVVFRMRANNLKKEWNNDLDDFLSSNKNRNGIEINSRFVKYTINDVKYMLMTSLVDKESDSIDLIKAMYHNRWNIETAYGYAKGRCSLANLHAKTITHLQEEFHANFLLLTIARLLEYHSINKATYDVVGGLFKRNVMFPKQTRRNETSPRNEVKVNFKKCIALVDKFLHSVLSDNIESRFDLLAVCVIKDLSAIRPNRHFKRVSISPKKKWQAQNREVTPTDPSG